MRVSQFSTFPPFLASQIVDGHQFETVVVQLDLSRIHPFLLYDVLINLLYAFQEMNQGEEQRYIYVYFLECSTGKSPVQVT